MRLNDIAPVVPVAVVRDDRFHTLGFLSDPEPGMLVFLEARDHLEGLLRTPEVSCVITTDALAQKLPTVAGLAVAADPRRVFIEVHNYLAAKTDFYGCSVPTQIDPTARVHSTAFVADRNVRIGAHTVIGPHVTVMEHCTIGASVRIWPGVVLGSEGFQTARCGGETLDMLHAGSIRIGDRVEILSNAVIASAVFRQATTVGEDARVGNLGFISHNVHVGPRTFIGHGATINGNVRIGADAWIGPGATVTNNITIGNDAKVSLGATVTKDVPAGQRVSGIFAVEHATMIRHLRSLR